ncbi:unnamed protein product [Closterium sp. Naga37s-1]|nr:unnamed protein product [Closterium sp. Naga37s-1]
MAVDTDWRSRIRQQGLSIGIGGFVVLLLVCAPLLLEPTRQLSSTMHMPPEPDPTAAASTLIDQLPEPGALATHIAIQQAGSGDSDSGRADNSEEVPRLEANPKESTRLQYDASQHVCWSSSDALVTRTTPGGAAAPSEAAAAPAAAAAAAAGRGVVVGGRGCSGCVQGEECSIHVWVMPPAYWVSPLGTNRSDGGSMGGNSNSSNDNSSNSSNDNSSNSSNDSSSSSSSSSSSNESSSSSSSSESSWLKNDLTLILEGPALGNGDVQCLDRPACSHYLISYRLWDVGTYSATLAVGCSNLNFSPDFAAHFNSTFRHDLATWSLSIGWPEKSASGNVPASVSAAGNDARDGAADMEAGGFDAMTSATASANTTSPDTTFPGILATPCTPGSVPGRWKKDSSGKYTWTFFPCAPPLSPPSRWISDLRRKGIEEINIVGDSHQRVLSNHLHFLLSGSTGDVLPDPRFNYTFHSRNANQEAFRINYYWVDGIFRNGEFGCG